VELIQAAIDFFLHLDKHLDELVRNFGVWSYLVLFLIIFCETGLVVTPFLPGDSLLFAIGTFAVVGELNVIWLLITLMIAAVAGDTVNYWIGYLLAPKVFRNENIRFIKKEYLERTRQFYEKYGGKTIIIARFVPIIRTFAPFLAGVGSMTYWRFALYNVVGGILWVTSFVLGGYFFGNIEGVKKNFSLVIFIIIFISMMPGIMEFIRHHRKKTLTSLR